MTPVQTTNTVSGKDLPLPERGQKNPFTAVVSDALDPDKNIDPPPLKKGRVTKPDYQFDQNTFYLDRNVMKLPALYLGKMVNGLPDGEGSLYDPDWVLYYKGEFKAGVVHGKGLAYSSGEPNKVVFEGLFKNGFRDDGTMFYKDGPTYVGGFKNGMREGKGRYLRADGSISYEGEYKNDFREGIGRKFSRNGKIKYQGEFKNNEPNGFGKKFNQDDSYIEGTFENDFLIIGKMFYPNGSLHSEIEWNSTDHRYEGKIYFLVEGKTYVGHLGLDLKPNGFGRMTYHNKSKFYEGEWQNGQRHGLGIMHGRSWTKSGIWKNDKLDKNAAPERLA